MTTMNLVLFSISHSKTFHIVCFGWPWEGSDIFSEFCFASSKTVILHFENIQGKKIYKQAYDADMVAKLFFRFSTILHIRRDVVALSTK